MTKKIKDIQNLYARTLITPKASIYRSGPLNEEVEESVETGRGKGTGTGQPNNPRLYRVEYYSTAKDPGWYTHMESTSGHDAYRSMNELLKSGIKARMIEPGRKYDVKEENIDEGLDPFVAKSNFPKDFKVPDKYKADNLKKSSPMLAGIGARMNARLKKPSWKERIKSEYNMWKREFKELLGMEEEFKELISKGFTEEEAIAILDQLNESKKG